MKKAFLDYLSCPHCKGKLSLAIFSDSGREVIAGLLQCGCGEWYPIIGGIPRMLNGELKRNLVLREHANFLTEFEKQIPSTIAETWRSSIGDARKGSQSSLTLKSSTAKSFAFEWKTFHKLFDAYRANFINYIAPIDESFFQGKVVLDAGCGVGRHAYWAAKFGAEVVAMDLGDAVEAAAQNCHELPVHVVQGDIYHPPFSQIFDYVFSIGVLHHLPDPEAGFGALVPLVKKGGTISIWVYGRRHNISNVYIYETLRKLTRHIPHRLLHYLCYVPAMGVEFFNILYRIFAGNILTKGFAEYMPFKYYAQFPFEVKLNDAFDVLATPKSTYWLEEEIQSWFARAGLEHIRTLLLRKKSIKGFGVVPIH